MAKPRVHLLAAPLVGAAVLALSRDRRLALIAAGASVLIDVDHLLDFAVYRLTKQSTAILCLHHADLLAAGLAIALRQGWLAPAAGLGGCLYHVVCDALSSDNGRWQRLAVVARLLARPGPPVPVDEAVDFRAQPIWTWF